MKKVSLFKKMIQPGIEPGSGPSKATTITTRPAFHLANFGKCINKYSMIYHDDDDNGEDGWVAT
jgi:hypothetical protein